MASSLISRASSLRGLVVVEVRRGFVPPLVEHLRVLVDAVALGVEEVADVSGFPLAVFDAHLSVLQKDDGDVYRPVRPLYEPAHIRGGARSGRDDGLPGAAADVSSARRSNVASMSGRMSLAATTATCSST